jgi:hypothetical protein
MTVIIDIGGQQVLFTATGFRGGHFTGHWAGPNTSGPGWTVWGRNPAYGGSYVMETAHPAKNRRHHPHWNILTTPGWRTRREAQAVAAELNRRDADCMGAIASLGALHGTRFREDTTDMPLALRAMEQAVGRCERANGES